MSVRQMRAFYFGDHVNFSYASFQLDRNQPIKFDEVFLESTNSIWPFHHCHLLRWLIVLLAEALQERGSRERN